jgi:hypothetical protein
MELEKTKLSDVVRNTNFSTMSNNIILDTTEQNDERFKTMKYHNGRIFKKERVS